MQVDATHLTSLFENATEGIILTGREGKIVLVNPAAERIFGYAASELIGKTIEVLLPARVRAKHEDLRHEFYKEPQNRAMGHGRAAVPLQHGFAASNTAPTSFCAWEKTDSSRKARTVRIGRNCARAQPRILIG